MVLKMQIGEYARVFWILGFVIFIAGFLTGMLAIALIPTKPDALTSQFMTFMLGFITGMVAVSLFYVVAKMAKYPTEDLKISQFKYAYDLS